MMATAASTVSSVEIYKMRTVVLSYYNALLEMKRFPKLSEVRLRIHDHFVQEFSLDVRTRGRYSTFGASGEDDFLILLSKGRYKGYEPSDKEILDVLNTFEFSYYDRLGNLYNSPIQEVW